jgi:hypothetical protein
VVIPAPAGSAAANNSKKNNVTPEELGIMGLATATVAQSKPNEPCVPKEWDLNSRLSLETDIGYLSPGTPGTALPGQPEYYKNILMPGKMLMGREGANSQIRILGGTRERFDDLFNRLAQGAVRVQTASPDTFYCILPNSMGFVGKREVSKITPNPPTIDTNIKGMPSPREIKFIP